MDVPLELMDVPLEWMDVPVSSIVAFDMLFTYQETCLTSENIPSVHRQTPSESAKIFEEFKQVSWELNNMSNERCVPLQ